MIADHLQREQALNPEHSFIVQAPAGSGKTELLTQRFLRLLACVQEPEEILAITFTKKAAAEMRSRIHAALFKAQHQPAPLTLHEQKTWQLAKQALSQDELHQWNLLSNPNRLRVKTIDALNSLLTQQLPLLSHFGASPEISDNPHMLYRETVQTFLSHLEEKVEWSQAIAQLLTHLDNNMKQAEDLLIEMLHKRDQWLPHLMKQQHPLSLRASLEKNLTAIIQEHLLTLKNHFPVAAAAELITLVKFAVSHLSQSNPQSPLIHCQSLQALPGCSAQDLAAWRGIATLLFTQEQQWRKKIDSSLGFPPGSTPYKKRLLDLIEELSAHEALSTAFKELFFLPDPCYSHSQWEILQALYEVLKIVVAQLHVTFKQRGKIDYIENAQAALLALGSDEEPTDLALVLDYQIKHILVDEFQDTSTNQFRLLERLVSGWQPGEPRSLFLVGDPMQSIYRFREAEVGLFIRARQQGLGPISLKPLTLSVNFRSTTALIDWVNNHFNQIMPKEDHLADGAVAFTASVAPTAPKAQEPRAVHVHAFTDTRPEVQAATLIRLVEEELKQHPQQSIAVLVRSRAHLTAIIPAFKKAQLAFQAIEIDPLVSSPFIQDLLALTRALLYPNDRVAWLSLLRAPWCGLSLADLLLVAGADAKAPLWLRLQEQTCLSSLSTEGQKRLERLVPILQMALRERQRQPLHEWVETTWSLLGGPASLEETSALDDVKTFFALLKTLEHSGPYRSLQWQSLQASLKKLYAQSNTSSQIQIMTIHNAKGLEFDTVIIPHLERGTKASEKPLLTWLERPLLHDHTALLLAPLHAVDEDMDNTYLYIRRQEKLKIKYENSRLLYVAATRAKQKLHLLTAVKKNAQEELILPVDNSLLRSLWPAVQHTLTPSALPALSTQQHSKSPQLRRLVMHWQNPYALTLVERPLHNKIQGFHLQNDNALILGITIHRILQELAQSGLEWWQQHSPKQQEAYIYRLLRQQGILSADLKDYALKVNKAIANTLADTIGRWILEQKDAQAELALTAMIDHQPQMLIIDRTFVDQNNIRWIIDYKTSTPASGQTLKDFLNQEKEKYFPQLLTYYQAVQQIDSRKICLGLYFPLIPYWLSLK